jgi:hypothetical protein
MKSNRTGILLLALTILLATMMFQTQGMGTSVSPTITLNPTMGMPNTQVTVNGHGFDPSDTCGSPASTSSNPSGLIGVISSCAFNSGNLTLVFFVSYGASPRSYTVTITGSMGDNASAQFMVGTAATTVTATATVTSTSQTSTTSTSTATQTIVSATSTSTVHTSVTSTNLITAISTSNSTVTGYVYWYSSFLTSTTSTTSLSTTVTQTSTAIVPASTTITYTIPTSTTNTSTFRVAAASTSTLVVTTISQSTSTNTSVSQTSTTSTTLATSTITIPVQVLISQTLTGFYTSTSSTATTTTTIVHVSTSNSTESAPSSSLGSNLVILSLIGGVLVLAFAAYYPLRHKKPPASTQKKPSPGAPPALAPKQFTLDEAKAQAKKMLNNKEINQQKYDEYMVQLDPSYKPDPAHWTS